MSAKKALNVNVDADLLAQARALGINMSSVMEQALKIKLAEKEAESWKRKHASEIAQNVHFLEENGLPLADLRQF
ncbi:MAG: type II toxin-antitoxin system CcdA family antitoxin [Beijerinckiaceae bacterium]